MREAVTGAFFYQPWPKYGRHPAVGICTAMTVRCDDEVAGPSSLKSPIGAAAYPIVNVTGEFGVVIIIKVVLTRRDRTIHKVRLPVEYADVFFSAP